MAPKPEDEPKPSSIAPTAIEDLFTNLKKHIQRSEFQEAVKVADQVLAIASGDEDVVALIKKDELDKALPNQRFRFHRSSPLI